MAASCSKARRPNLKPTRQSARNGWKFDRLSALRFVVPGTANNPQAFRASTAVAACNVSLESQPFNNGSAPAIAASMASQALLRSCLFDPAMLFAAEQRIHWPLPWLYPAALQDPPFRQTHRLPRRQRLSCSDRTIQVGGRRRAAIPVAPPPSR